MSWVAMPCDFSSELRLLDIGRIGTVGAAHNGFLSCFGEDHKFVGERSSDQSCLCLYGLKSQSASSEDARVGIHHPYIAFISGLLIDIETVGVLHDEFSSSHHAEAGSDLVPEFSLDLIEVKGHLTIRSNLLPGKISDDFLMGWA